MSTESETEAIATLEPSRPAETDSPAFEPAPTADAATATDGAVPHAGESGTPAGAAGSSFAAESAATAPATGSGTPTEPIADPPTPPASSVDASGTRGIDWERHAAAAGRWLIRPRVRLTIIGVALVLIAALWVSDSLWELILIVAGILMIIVAWAGSKLEGHLRIDWGESGTEFEFRTKVHSQSRGLTLSAPSYDAPSTPASAAGTAVATRVEPAPPVAAAASQAATAAPRVDLALVPADPDVIEGTGRTVEIDLDQLKGLIAAAEAEDAARAARRIG